MYDAGADRTFTQIKYQRFNESSEWKTAPRCAMYDTYSKKNCRRFCMRIDRSLAGLDPQHNNDRSPSRINSTNLHRGFLELHISLHYQRVYHPRILQVAVVSEVEGDRLSCLRHRGGVAQEGGGGK